MMIRRLGLECGVADDGAQAVDMAAIRQRDAILLDYLMPKMNGVEAARRIRTERANQHTHSRP